MSRKTYNHLVTVKYNIAGFPRTSRIVDTFGVPNEVMKDIRSSKPTLSIIPQEYPQTITIDTYFSTTGSVKGTALETDKYRSDRANVINVSRKFLECNYLQAPH